MVWWWNSLFIIDGVKDLNIILIAAVVNTGYNFTENYLKLCERNLNKVRRICNENTCKYTKNFYEAQKKINSLKSTKLCTQNPTLKMCAGNVLFHLNYILIHFAEKFL